MDRWQRLVFLLFMLTLFHGRNSADFLSSDDIAGCSVNDVTNTVDVLSMDTLIPTAEFELEGFEYTVYENSEMNWCAARAHCMGLGSGSHLADVTSASVALKLMEERIYADIWTGGRAKECQWVWENSRDDDDIDIVEHCLYVELRGDRNIPHNRHEDCGKELGFMCQKACN